SSQPANRLTVPMWADRRERPGPTSTPRLLIDVARNSVAGEGGDPRQSPTLGDFADAGAFKKGFDLGQGGVQAACRACSCLRVFIYHRPLLSGQNAGPTEKLRRWTRPGFAARRRRREAR